MGKEKDSRPLAEGRFESDALSLTILTSRISVFLSGIKAKLVFRNFLQNNVKHA